MKIRLKQNFFSSQLHIIPHVIPSGDEGHFPSPINHFPSPINHFPSSIPPRGAGSHFPFPIFHFSSSLFHLPSYQCHCDPDSIGRSNLQYLRIRKDLPLAPCVSTCACHGGQSRTVFTVKTTR